MFFRMLTAVLSFAFMAMYALPASALNARSFVSVNGSDAASCGRYNPCRSINQGIAATQDNGEVVVLDTGAYGPFIVNKPVSIIASPGVHASVSVSAAAVAGATVNVPGAGNQVVLRGIAFTNNGGTYGVDVQDGDGVSIENCSFKGFDGAGVHVSVSRVAVTDSSFGGNTSGVWVDSNGAALVSKSKFYANSFGVYVRALSSGGTTALADVVDTTLSGNAEGGILVIDDGGTIALANISRVISNDNSGYGIFVGGENAIAYVSNSTAMGNGSDMNNIGGSMYSTGNNVVGAAVDLTYAPAFVK